MTGQIDRYRVLEILEFTSARKRMRCVSVCVRERKAVHLVNERSERHGQPLSSLIYTHSVIVEAEDGQILILAKGADAAMIPRLRPGQVCVCVSMHLYVCLCQRECLYTYMCACHTA